MSPELLMTDRRASRPRGAPATTLYPLQFEPILKRIVWGGRRLGEVLGKPIGSGSDYAESWELSDHGLDESRVADGPLAGRSLRDLLAESSTAILGPAVGPRDQFPLLVKFLDAHRNLSVQVHPDDALGRRLADDNGKTEAWVVLHAEPGSLIYSGLRAGVDRSTFESALESGAVEPLLHRFEPKAGDCLFIPAGTVHAIGAGVMVAEVQQMSDATFRVFDWGRLGTDGRPRTLHISEALASIDFDAGPVVPVTSSPLERPWGTIEHLVTCRYFALDRLRLRGEAEVGSTERFSILVGLGGEAEVRHDRKSYPIGFGQTLLLPAQIGTCRIVPSGDATLLTCSIP